ncbi:MAG: TonB-dependent receptor [Gemmatimonadales bacterium]
MRPSSFRSLLAALLLSAGAVPLAAQGILSGTVLDNGSGLAVTGAVVRISALDREAVTDRNGRFILTGVPTGAHMVLARYIGYQPLERTVTVNAGASTTLEFRLAPAQTSLGELIVIGTRAGQAAALNQQMNAPNVTNVIAADQIGRFPDANLGDALKRIPGITIGLDQGEARFGSIRGTEPRFNTVMINGERVPSAEAEVREVQLDLIPADIVQAVEVNKTLTPDMDADAIGGAVNVVTRAAPPERRIAATLGGGYNFIRSKASTVGSVVLGNRFLSGRLGAIVSGSYYDHRFGSDNKEGVWNQTDDGLAYVEEFDVRRYDVQRTRRSLSASLDWRLGEASTIMFRSLYNHRDDWENRFRLRYAFDEPEADGTQVAELRRQTKGGGPEDRLKQARLEDQRTQSHQLSGEHLLGGRITLRWAGNIASAAEKRPDERYIEWRARDVLINPNYSNPMEPQFAAATPSEEAASAFQLRRIEVLESLTEDKDRNARVDLTIPIGSGRASRIQVGARYRGKDKFRENTYDFAEPTNEGEFASLASTPNQDYTTSRNYAGRYTYGSFSTPDFLASLPVFDASRFTIEDQPGEYAAGNYDASESISAGYAMLEQALSRSVSVIAGVRVERTSVTYNGFEFDIDEETVRPTRGSRSYTDVLPSINLRWDAAPHTVVRAAWTSTLARPNYYDLVPYRAISLDDNELETGNPDLRTTKSMNWDLMLERYFESVGLVSIGIFHKSITDFIFNFTDFNAVDPVTGLSFSQISQPRNGASARLTGVELAAQRQLSFLPGLLRYLGIYANYTFNSSSVSGLDIEGRSLESLPLLGTAKHNGNLSLSFDAPRVSLRAAVNYQSESLDAGEGGYNEEAFFDRWADRRTDVDVNGSVRVLPTMQFFFEANNLTNRPLRFYQGTRGRLMQDEYYGRRIQTGFKFDF